MVLPGLPQNMPQGALACRVTVDFIAKIARIAHALNQTVRHTDGNAPDVHEFQVDRDPGAGRQNVTRARSGNLKARARVEYVKRTLEEIGIEPERIEMYNLSSAMGGRFAEIAEEMTERIRELGPSPVGASKAA